VDTHFSLTMERTKKSKFLVKREDNSSVFSSPSLNHWWFKAIETQHENSVRIPLIPTEYDDDEMYDRLRSLSHGDVVEAVLEREDETEPWKPIELEKVTHFDHM